MFGLSHLTACFHFLFNGDSLGRLIAVVTSIVAAVVTSGMVALVGVALSGWNLPEIKLLEEMDFIVSIHELWEDVSVISQVVNQVQEGFSITVEEDLVVDLLEVVHSIEHFFEDTIFAECEYISFCHQVMGSSDVKSNDFTVEVD